jgi:hypothetical protein
MPRALLAFAAATVLAVAAHAADRPTAAEPPLAVPPEPHLAAAHDALLVAREHLGITGASKNDGYGGHRKLALELVNTALEQVEAGLRIAAEEAARREAEAKRQAPPKRRRR